MMKWPLRQLFSKKYQVNLVLNRLEGLSTSESEESKLYVDLKWKGPKGALGSRFRSMKREKTNALPLEYSGCITWNKEFEHVCVLTNDKAGVFQPWHVYFVLCKALPETSKGKPSVLGTAILDLGFLAASGNASNFPTTLPVKCKTGDRDVEATFGITFSLSELRTVYEAGFESVHRLMAPAMACIGGDPYAWEPEDDDVGKVHPDVEKKKKSSKELSREQVLGLKGKKNLPVEDVDPNDGGKFSPRSDGSVQDALDLFDSDWVDDSDYEYGEEVEEPNIGQFVSYGTLTGVNLVVEGALPHHAEEAAGAVTDEIEVRDNIHSRAAVMATPKVDTTPEELSTSESGEPVPQGSLMSMLSWRKRKLSFRSPRSRGEPLLNKAYGEEGGDEIDWHRRQAESNTEFPEPTRQKSEDSVAAVAGALDFGETLFAVGTWEEKDLISRDGRTQLSTNVFFASFDQRSESAAGESACTALVAVIADWLHKHPTLVPSKAEFDMLIREGSAEWRNLCTVEAFKDRFADKHFDLETVIEAAVRPLSVVPEKSFVGFFVPEGVSESLDFLQDAMSFDSIWEEVERAGPAVYIVSWNDHFFVLKLEEDRCYIIDTLGERLQEGGEQAYILQFDAQTSLGPAPIPKAEDSKIAIQPETAAAEVSDSLALVKVGTDSDPTPPASDAAATSSETPMELVVSTEKVHNGGKATCCQFIKEFFAALPLRELQSDIKKGLLGKVPLHQRLQIEFHYTTSRPCTQLVPV